MGVRCRCAGGLGVVVGRYGGDGGWVGGALAGGCRGGWGMQCLISELHVLGLCGGGEGVGDISVRWGAVLRCSCSVLMWVF